MIRFEQISKEFGGVPAVRDVTCRIPKGQTTIFAGADGAGKSTIFKMIIGLLKKNSGDIYFKDEPVGRSYDAITAVTGYMPERFSLYMDLSVEENMNFFADIHQVPKKKREERKHQLLEKTGMMRFRGRRAGALSGGMKQKLALSTILLAAPEFIILDEPTTGVDPLSRIEFFHIIDDLKAEGKTIVISTPYLDEAEQGDHIVFMKEGRVIETGAIDDLKKNFPAKLFRILPEGHIFDVLKEMSKVQGLENNLYIRGKFLKYLETGDPNLKNKIPAREIIEEKPKLEDMYLFYERRGKK